MISTGIYLRYGVFSLVGASLIVLIALSIDKAIDSLDSMLIPCQHGTPYSMGSCFCQGTPFVGKFCGICNCSAGTCEIGGTVPRITSDYGCKCPGGSKFFGFLCDRCHAQEKLYSETDNTSVVGCKGTCDDEYFGLRCERRCFAHLSYSETLPIDVTGDAEECRDLRSDGGICSPCSGHGTCNDGFCECDKNYYDDGPSKCSKTCPPASNGQICSGRGVCKLYGNTPSCLCETGWRGTECSVPCPGVQDGAKPCHGHGACLIDYANGEVNPYCDCFEMYKGDSCQILCPGDHDEECTGHGTCIVKGNEAECICETGMLEWNGPGCNCTDLLTCNAKGTCVDGSCVCVGNFDGKHCMNCKKDYYGSLCNLFCDGDADYDSDPAKMGCHGRGICTVYNRDTSFESVGCDCERNEIIERINGKKVRMYSTYETELNCKDCVSGFFPKVGIFEEYNTIPLGLYVPCQISCVESTCNEEGICNELYGKPGEPLCVCDSGPQGHKHLNDTAFCTKCSDHWYPEQVRTAEGCTNFCIPDLSDYGGSFPLICEEGDINCVHCNGRGACTPSGECECSGGYTGDFCQIQCTSDSGVICGGHGVCETNDLQSLLQFELQYVEDSGALYQCTCDPQDPYTQEARDRYIADGDEGALDPPPEPSYFGETCDYHCLKPPWIDSDECNDLGNCTIYEIYDPGDNTFDCYKDDDCQITDIQRIISGDASWHDKKGPFCKKTEYPEGCEGDNYHIDDCLDILTLQRPPKSRSKQCVENTLCRQTLDKYDWHQWCANIIALNTPDEFVGCGSISQFCPANDIPTQCSHYVSMTEGVDIAAHMNYCYEYDKRMYPFKQTLAYRLDDESAELHDLISNEMRLFHEEFPTVHIDISDYCVNHVAKFYTRITTVHTNERFVCGSRITSEHMCKTAIREVDTYKPFAVKCPNQLDVLYRTLEEANTNRGFDCIVHEVEKRYIVPNEGNVPYGGVCYENSDCQNGLCNENSCCANAIPNCKRCNTIGQCVECKVGTFWTGLICVGTPTDDTSLPSLTGTDQKKGIDLIDATCDTATQHFPQCIDPVNICEVNPCKGEDTCTPSERDGICHTSEVLDCTCKYGLQCVPLTFNSYKCIGEFSDTDCPQQYRDFNWFDYCTTNSPVLKEVSFSSDILTKELPEDGYSIPLTGQERHTEFIHYWVQPTTIFSSSKYLQVRSYTDIVARVYLHQGQIQLNGIQALESCPIDNPTCQETWGYEPNTWYHIEIEIDYATKKIRLHKDNNIKEDDFICSADCSGITTITDVSIHGTTETYYDQIVFEKKIPDPSIATTCDSYLYCDMDVNYRHKCSDMIRNVRYPSLLEPKGDIIDTCKNFFDYQSFGTYDLAYHAETKIKTLDWDHYCLFYDSITGDFNCNGLNFQYFEDYVDCGPLLEPLEGNETCMDTALGYNWATYCDSLVKTSIPADIKNSCPKACYKHFKDYGQCEDRLAMFEDKHHLKTSICGGDWVDYCVDVTMDKHKGTCAAVECRCDYDKYEGTGGQSCELSCKIASDGSPCGEESGVGKCSYTDRDQQIYDAGALNSEGDWIAWQKSKFEIIGQCDCFLSEGKDNCDQVCLKCNESVYDEQFISPPELNHWMGSDILNLDKLYVGSSGSATVSGDTTITLDMREDHVISGVYVTGAISSFNVSLSMDNVFYEHANCNGEPNCTITEFNSEVLYNGRCSTWQYLDIFASDPEMGLSTLECISRCQDANPAYTGSIRSSDNGCLCSIIDCNTIEEVDNYVTWKVDLIGSGRFHIRGYGRFMKVEIMEGSGALNMGMYITEAGQIGSCNSGTGACECLAPFTSVVEEQYTNWRGIHSKRFSRVYGLPEQYNTADEFRIRAMQGKESFTKKYIKNKKVFETTTGWQLGPMTVEECQNYANSIPGGTFGYSFSRPGPGCTAAGTNVKFNPTVCDPFDYRSSGYLDSVKTPTELDCGSPVADLDSMALPGGCLRKDGINYFNSNIFAGLTTCGTDGYDCADYDSERCACMPGLICLSIQEVYAYEEGQDWKLLYDQFRENPSDFFCTSGEPCTRHDFILLGNLHKSSNRYNFDCNTHCENIHPITKIPCAGHGSCKVTGDCICDPAAYISGTDPMTGFSRTFNIGDGEEIEDSDYEATRYETTGWRGIGCDKMCPGYDPVKKSMLEVCGGHGICNGDANCDCDMGYTGEYCQFKCPGFEEGDENVCSGHGTCVLNTIEVIGNQTFLLYEGRCSTWQPLDIFATGFVYGLTIEQCIDQCAAANDQYTGTMSHDNGCLCSFKTCDVIESNKYYFNTYATMGGGDVNTLPVDCEGIWSGWSECDGERQRRDFAIETQPAYGGEECPPSPEYKRCRFENVDCEGTWSDYSDCDGEYRSRSLQISVQPEYNGFECPLSPSYTVCTRKKVDCDGTWGQWSGCYDFIRQREFTITVNASNNGLSCPDTTQTIECTSMQTNCIYTNNGWGECDKGQQTKTYTIHSQPTNDGNPCPKEEHRSCTECTDDSKCTSNICRDGHCCFGATGLCSKCDHDGYCLACGTSASFNIYGKCVCDDGYEIMDIGLGPSCILTQRRLRKPIRRRLGEWSQWGLCLNDTRVRVRHKTVTIHISRDHNKSFMIDGLKDPHLEIDIQREDDTHEHEQYIHTYTSKVRFKRLDEGYPVMLVREEDCLNCSTGIRTDTPLFESIIPVIKYGEDYVDWSPLLEHVGVYYLITPKHRSMITKITVTNSSNDEFRTLETRNCITNRHKLRHTLTDVCEKDSDCKHVCLDGRCCNKNDTLCVKCNNKGYCSKCKQDTQMINGTCQPIDCNTHYGVSHLIYVEGKGCKHRLGSTQCTSHSDCGTGTNGRCLGGTCCNALYENFDNCLQCNDGTRTWKWEHVPVATGGSIYDPTGFGQFNFKFGDAMSRCEYYDGCKSIDNTLSDGNIWNMRTGHPNMNAGLCIISGDALAEITSGPPNLSVNKDDCREYANCIGYSWGGNSADGNVQGCFVQHDYNVVYYNENTASTATCESVSMSMCIQKSISQSYTKTNIPDQYCSICMFGTIWFDETKSCQPLNCPTGQKWEPNIGCRSGSSGEADEKMQLPIQKALAKAYCYPGFYKDIELDQCLPILMRPKTDVTLYLDQGEVTETSMTFRCEIRGATVMSCPQCTCMFDFIYGKWSSFECETCLKGFGKKQCRTICPGYDGENQESMCSDNGVCQTGSLVMETGERVFKDASCMCGNPPAVYNADRSQMQTYLAIYTELASISYEMDTIRCLDEATVQDGFDMCYHFDETLADCSTCVEGFSGKNCQYKCEKCLLDGACSGQPSNTESGACTCKKPFDYEGMPLWAYNCCPLGFRVTDLDGFNAMTQEEINIIQLPPNYDAGRFVSSVYESVNGDRQNDFSVTEAQCQAYAEERQIEYINSDLCIGGCVTGCRTMYLNGYSIGEQPYLMYYIPEGICDGYRAGTVNECFAAKIGEANGCRYNAEGTNLEWGCIFYREAIPQSQAVVDADWWCKPCPGVNDNADDGSWLESRALNEICGGIARGDCYRKNNTHNACRCREGNGGTGLAKDDWVGMSCSCNADYWAPYKNLWTKYGCNGLGTCLDDVVNIGGVDIACAPQAGYYLNAAVNAQGDVVTSVEPAAVGQHIPQNGQLYITDDTGRDCAYGTAPNGKLCLNCNNGYYQDLTAQNTCKACPAGKRTFQVSLWGGTEAHNYGQTECFTCPVGRFSSRIGDTSILSSGANICLQCPEGRYQDQSGQNSCKKCPSGKVRAFNGLLSSAADTDALPGECTTCVRGKFQKGGVSASQNAVTAIPEYAACVDCPHGLYGTGVAIPEGGPASCSQCPSGQYSSNGAASCTNCEAGRFSYSNGNAEHNFDNPPNVIYGESPTYNAAFVSNGGNGYPCQASLSGWIMCPARDGWTYHSEKSWKCEQASNGYWQWTNKGYFGLDMCTYRPYDCYGCAAGKYNSGGSSSCPACPKGYKCLGSQDKTPCPAGKYTDQTGQSSCKGCNGGTKFQPLEGQDHCENIWHGRALMPFQSNGDSCETDCRCQYTEVDTYGDAAEISELVWDPDNCSPKRYIGGSNSVWDGAYVFQSLAHPCYRYCRDKDKTFDYNWRYQWHQKDSWGNACYCYVYDNVNSNQGCTGYETFYSNGINRNKNYNKYKQGGYATRLAIAALCPSRPADRTGQDYDPTRSWGIERYYKGHGYPHND